jgi:hypothetical protein
MEKRRNLDVDGYGLTFSRFSMDKNKDEGKECCR